MKPPSLSSAKQFLLWPSLIIGEIAAIALTGVAGTAFPHLLRSPGFVAITLLARPFRLDCPLTLDSVRATRYHEGDVKDLRLALSLARLGRVQKKEMAINQELRVPGGRIFLGFEFGPAALLEWQKGAANDDCRLRIADCGLRIEIRNPKSEMRECELLLARGRGMFEGTSLGLDGMVAHLRARVDEAGNHPAQVEVRVMKGKALALTAAMRTGETATLQGGHTLTLHGTPFWVRLRASRDPALWLAYAGFALVLAGATLMFAVVKVDTCVTATPEGDKERVFVALRAQRFAPLFEERFQRLVREQGGET
ncbi:MAG: cytochrome c biogenesis protein ResB [Planctomycetes bacterium]|nr:cytochrome c biogenesis protein ResB [Planctomycetota bacterium]